MPLQLADKVESVLKNRQGCTIAEFIGRRREEGKTFRQVTTDLNLVLSEFDLHVSMPCVYRWSVDRLERRVTYKTKRAA